MKTKISFIIERDLIKQLKKEAINNDKKYSDMLSDILNYYFTRNDNPRAEELEDMF